jgi:hypothetical protein
MGAGGSYSSKDFKVKIYNAMESADGSESSEQIDKGKGIDKGSDNDNGENGAKPLDKGKGIDRKVHRIELGPGHCTEPPFVT